MTDEQKQNLKKVVKTFKFAAEQNKTVKPQNLELPSQTVLVTGLIASADSKSKLNFRGSLRISIGGDELIETETPAQIFLSSVGVDVNKRFWDLGDIEPGDFSFKPEYTDEDNAAAAWDGGYNVKLTLETWQNKR